MEIGLGSFWTEANETSLLQQQCVEEKSTAAEKSVATPSPLFLLVDHYYQSSTTRSLKVSASPVDTGRRRPLIVRPNSDVLMETSGDDGETRGELIVTT